MKNRQQGQTTAGRSKRHWGAPGCAPALSGTPSPAKAETSPGKQKAAAVNWQPQGSSTALPAALTVHPPSVPSPCRLRSPDGRRIRSDTPPDSTSPQLSHGCLTHKTLAKLRGKPPYNPDTRFGHGPCLLSVLTYPAISNINETKCTVIMTYFAKHSGTRVSLFTAVILLKDEALKDSGPHSQFCF